MKRGNKRSTGDLAISNLNRLPDRVPGGFSVSLGCSTAGGASHQPRLLFQTLGARRAPIKAAEPRLARRKVRFNVPCGAQYTRRSWLFVLRSVKFGFDFTVCLYFLHSRAIIVGYYIATLHFHIFLLFSVSFLIKKYPAGMLQVDKEVR